MVIQENKLAGDSWSKLRLNEVHEQMRVTKRLEGTSGDRPALPRAGQLGQAAQERGALCSSAGEATVW